jgi:hypothetical protein
LRLARTGAAAATLEAITNASGMEELDLTGSHVPPEALPRLGVLHGLVILGLGGLDLTEALPIIASLRGLRTLALPFARLPQGWAPLLAGLPRLASLDLTATGATDEDVRTFGPVGSLEELLLSSDPVGDEGVIAVSRLPRLRHIALSASAVGARGLRAVTEMVSLQKLELAYLSLTDEELASLGAAPALLQVDLTQTSAGDHTACALPRQLRAARFFGTSITRASVACLVAHPSLEYLDVRETDLDDATVAKLEHARDWIVVNSVADDR